MELLQGGVLSHPQVVPNSVVSTGVQTMFPS